jgi:hypothetical protein
MANVIRHKRGTSDPVAGDFSNTGELLVNTSDGGVFTKTDGGTVVEIGSTAASLRTARTIALSGDVSGSTSFDGSANVTITATVADDSHNHVVSNVDGLQTALDAKAALASPALTGTPTAPTAAAGTNTTQVATTAFVSTAVANVVDSAPGALDTLNELAAALGDDANFSTTVTNSIATKLPLSGGQMTGNITFSGSQTVDGRDLSADGAKLDGIAAGAQVNVATNLGVTTTTTSNTITSSTGTNATIGEATSSAAGLMSTTHHNKLDGIAAGATNVTNNNQLTNGAGYITSSGSISGNAATATTLQTARTINGTSFNGSANITITANTPNTLSRGSYLTGSNFNGGSATTWAVDATSSNTANKVVARDGNGDFSGRYIYSSYFNNSHSQTTRNSDTEFYSGTGGWLYKNTASGMRSSLNVPTRTGGDASGTWGINITGNASGTSGYVASQGNYNTSASTTAASYGVNVRLDFVQSNNGWPSYGSVLHWSAYTGGGGGCQFYAPYGSAYGGTQLRYRLADYNNGNNWTSWKTIPDLDATQTFNGANRGQVDALSSASTITPNFNNSNNFSISLSTNTTIANPSNLTAGQSGAIAITYNGGYTVAFGSYWKFPGGTAPTATSTSGKTDVLAYYVESSTRISAVLLLNTGG